MPSLSVFLDLGGVIINKDQQITQWQSLVGECFAELLGGDGEAWTRAFRIVTHHLEQQEEARGRTSADFMSFYWSYQLRWIRGMCEEVGITAPAEEECLALADRAIASITRRVQAALPGSVEAIRILHHRGYSLHLASGSCSLELAGYLDGLGVRHCFGRLYGADLINTFKEGPEYYVRLFADVGIRPEEALVVDDSPQAISWVVETGAKTVLVSASAHPEAGAIPRIECLAQLPAFLKTFPVLRKQSKLHNRVDDTLLDK
ncbi:MAG TPA: HAD family hydrolase [Ktedonosporobacter sp.]|jgi:HAD superfamily hydrolase (TIGR01509 family)|nr:HAD family hydrolase [Ktedonosporobacter sp.]